MRTSFRFLLLVPAAFFACESPVLAGMPSLTLTEIARMRIEVISFFLLMLLVCAWIVQAIWNYVRTDLPALPRLGYAKALGVIVLWSLLFLLVLTMISGARELMTPGAWEKEGITYKLKDEQAKHRSDENLAVLRVSKLENLRSFLWTYAKSHSGKFPGSTDDSQFPEAVWEIPDPSLMRYIYVGGLEANTAKDPLAYEPGIFGDEREVLFTDGKVESLPIGRLLELLKEPKR